MGSPGKHMFDPSGHDRSIVNERYVRNIIGKGFRELGSETIRYQATISESLGFQEAKETETSSQ